MAAWHQNEQNEMKKKETTKVFMHVIRFLRVLNRGLLSLAYILHSNICFPQYLMFMVDLHISKYITPMHQSTPQGEKIFFLQLGKTSSNVKLCTVPLRDCSHSWCETAHTNSSLALPTACLCTRFPCSIYIQDCKRDRKTSSKKRVSRLHIRGRKAGKVAKHVGVCVRVIIKTR